MKVTVKSPKNTEIQIDLAAKTVTIEKINMINQPIQGWGVTRHEGDNCAYVTVGGKNVVIHASDLKKVSDARHEYSEKKLEAAVPGISLLRAAMRGEAAYFEAMQAMMDDEMNDGVKAPARQKLDLEAIRAQYPRAALYAKADGYHDASHYAKSSAGKKAMELLENGGSTEDAEEILNGWHKDSYID